MPQAFSIVDIFVARKYPKHRVVYQFERGRLRARKETLEIQPITLQMGQYQLSDQLAPRSGGGCNREIGRKAETANVTAERMGKLHVAQVPGIWDDH